MGEFTSKKRDKTSPEEQTSVSSNDGRRLNKDHSDIFSSYPPAMQRLFKGIGNSGVENVLKRLQLPENKGDIFGKISRVTIDESAAAKSLLEKNHAVGATDGRRIMLDPGLGSQKAEVLGHELAHVIQLNAHGVPRISSADSEKQADLVSQNTPAHGAPLSVGAASPGLHFKKKKIPDGDRVTKIVIAGNSAIISFRSAKGGTYQLQYHVSHNLPPSSKPYTLVGGTGIKGLDLKQKALISFKGGPDFKASDVDPEIELFVYAKGKLPGAGGKGKKSTGSGDDDSAGGGGKKKQAEKPPETALGGDTVKGDEQSNQEGDRSKQAADASLVHTREELKDVKVPVVTITDIKQIDELKKKGLLPAKTAEEIKTKLEEKKELTFEEAVNLMDAYNSLVTGETKKDAEKEKAKESWLDWAEFIEENKEKLSGKVKRGDGKDTLSVDDVKKIIKKHKKFVGVTDPPKKRSSKDARYDPQLRESWNNLQDWEKQLWNQYLEEYGDSLDVTDGASSLKLTDAVKFSMALRISPKYMPAGARAAAIEMFNDPIFIGGTMLGIGIYLASWISPEPIISKAAAVTITIALLTLFSASEIYNLASAWGRLSTESSNAKSIDDIEKAAEHFGKATGATSLRILITLATIIAGKALPKPTAPPPGGMQGPAPAMVGSGPGGAAAMTTAVSAEEAAAMTIKVLKDGTIVILSGGSQGGAAGMMMSSMGGAGGPGGPEVLHGPRNSAEAIDDLERTVGKGRETRTRGKSTENGVREDMIPAQAGTQIEHAEVSAWSQKLVKEGFKVIRRNRFPQWLRRIFPGQGRPDLIAINESKKIILVGDVTSNPGTLVNRQFARQEQMLHIEKTIDYGKRLAADLPKEFEGFRIVVQERYWELSGKLSRLIKIPAKSGK